MAKSNQSFTNAPISDKKFDEIKEDPKAPTSKASNDSGSNQSVDPNELGEILFQAENVPKTDENPTLSVLDDVNGNVQAPPPNTPIDDAQHVTRGKERKSKKIVKRLSVVCRRKAKKAYGATDRAKKLKKIRELQEQIDYFQMENERLQSQLDELESAFTRLRQRLAKVKAYYDIMLKLKQFDHLDAVNEALIWMIKWVRSKFFYY